MQNSEEIFSSILCDRLSTDMPQSKHHLNKTLRIDTKEHLCSYQREQRIINESLMFP